MCERRRAIAAADAEDSDTCRIRPKLSASDIAQPAPQQPARLVPLEAPDALRRFNFDTDFFHRLADRRLGLGFTRFDLAAREADLERRALDGGAAAQHQPASVGTTAGDDDALAVFGYIITLTHGKE